MSVGNPGSGGRQGAKGNGGDPWVVILNRLVRVVAQEKVQLRKALNQVAESGR